MAAEIEHCPVCGGNCSLLDQLDLNRSCDVQSDKLAPCSGVLVAYYLCDQCRFCFAPQFGDWTLQQFADAIYNDEYVNFDPHYADFRPRTNAETLIKNVGPHSRSIRHLDYGGGDGLLSRLLREAGWQSTSFDPCVDTIDVAALGKFDFITAFEVFEHVPDVDRLMFELCSLRAEGGFIMFTTMLSDGFIAAGEPLRWWYAAPRNGHISLFSAKSLAWLGKRYGLRSASSPTGLHAYFTSVPEWAQSAFA
jgi:SAM-dependent methyltransferase